MKYAALITTLLLCGLSVSAGAACVVKPGTIGGKMLLPPGMKPVCGPERDKFLSGLKTAYRETGKTMPNPKWFELYALRAADPEAAIKPVDVVFNSGYKVADENKAGKLGYHFSNYKKPSGEWLMSVIVEPPPYETIYYAYIGY